MNFGTKGGILRTKIRKKHGRKADNMSICDTCSNYQYDEDYEYYVCMVDLDEDDMSQFLRGGSFSCAFYQRDDEYAVVRKQM